MIFTWYSQLKHCGYIREKLCRQSWNTGRTIEWLLERVTNLYVIRFRHFDTDINLVTKVVSWNGKKNCRIVVKLHHQSHRVLYITLQEIQYLELFTVYIYGHSISIENSLVTWFDWHMSMNTRHENDNKCVYQWLGRLLDPMVVVSADKEWLL